MEALPVAVGHVDIVGSHVLPHQLSQMASIQFQLDAFVSLDTALSMSPLILTPIGSNFLWMKL